MSGAICAIFMCLQLQGTGYGDNVGARAERCLYNSDHSISVAVGSVYNWSGLEVLEAKGEGKADKPEGKVRNAIGGLKDTLRGN
jgi:hypothetical protein